MLLTMMENAVNTESPGKAMDRILQATLSRTRACDFKQAISPRTVNFRDGKSHALWEGLGWQGSASERLFVTTLIKTYLVLGMVMSRLSTVEVVLVNEILLTLHSILVHLLKELHAQFDICDERLASASCEVLPHHHTEHLEVLGLRGHRVRRHCPSADA